MATYANPPGTIAERLNEIRTELGTQDTSEQKDVQATLQKLLLSVHRLVDLVEEISEHQSSAVDEGKT